MPIIATIGRQHWRIRILLGAMYGVLSLLGVTMVAPFMITLASSFSNDFDYERFTPVPRFLWSQSDRYCRGLVLFFQRYPKWYEQMACALPDMPAHWTTWRDAGRDKAGIDRLAGTGPTSAPRRDPAAQQKAAADYSQFVDRYPVEDLMVPVSDVRATLFLADHYRARWRQEHGGPASGARLDKNALGMVSARWGLPLRGFYSVSFEKSENLEPYWQQSWFPPLDPKYRDYLLIKEMYRHHFFTPGIAAKWAAYRKANGLNAKAGELAVLAANPTSELAQAWSTFKAEVAPAAPAVPFAVRAVWRAFLESPEAGRILKLPDTAVFDVATYNRIAGTAYTSVLQTPFPVPADASPLLRELWIRFVETRFPVHLTRIAVTPAATAQYRDFLRDRFKTVALANRMLETQAQAWEDFSLTAEPPAMTGEGGLRSVWIDYVKNLPAAQRQLRCSEIDYQTFLLHKYGSLAAINAAHGLALSRIEEAIPPFADAYAVTFARNEWSLSLRPLIDNYRFILTYLLKQGRALAVTLLLILSSIFLTLTVNPMCAYALSRFGLRGKDRIILYLLATMAFPAMISAIPAYLLMRDLGLLNTFFALLLPGAANGMGIFMLKGFFDSLPPELYEAATIDGAKERQIFLIITLPLMKPILAINALNAFIAAYSGWEWALIICQKQDMWTLSVWMYQANQLWAMDYPWIVAAGFVVVSIPTLLVFTFCQRIILQGIILPQMK